MAELNVLIHKPILPGQTAAPDLIGARRRAAILIRIGYGLALVVLSCAAVLYPLVRASGNWARSTGYIATLDSSSQTLSYQANGLTASIEVSDATKVYLNGRAVKLEDLRIGDHAVVKYDSIFRLAALEIDAIGKRP